MLGWRFSLVTGVLVPAAPLGVFRSRQAFRGAPELLTAAMQSLAYVTKENWYGVDALNISVVDGKGHDDAATIILDVDRAPDRPFLEVRADEAAPLYRYGGFGGSTGAWGPAALLFLLGPLCGYLGACSTTND